MRRLSRVLRVGLVATLAFFVGSASIALAVDDGGGLRALWSALFAERPTYLESGDVPADPVNLGADPYGPITCATRDYTATAPQQAFLNGWVALWADGPVNYTVATASSTNAGASWTLDAFGWNRGNASADGEWATASYTSLVNLEAGTTYRFAFQLGRSFAAGGTGNGRALRCHLVVQITNRNTAQTPAPRGHVKIVSSFPMQGSAAADAQSVVNAITMALEEANFHAGDVSIDYVPMDDSTAAAQNWNAAQEAANANAAASDPAVVAYIGPFNSGAARVSIPILCQAGLVMLSPSNTYVGLTKPGAAGEPGVYYPNGCARNYTRDIPSDDVQGAVAAKLARSTGAQHAYIVSENTVYASTIASAFALAAGQVGLAVVGNETVGAASSFTELATRVQQSNADVLYYAGFLADNAGRVARDARAAVPNVRVAVTEGIAVPAFIEAAGPASDGAIATIGEITAPVYSQPQAQWAARYASRFNAQPGSYAIYAYEDTNVVITALRTLGEDRTDRQSLRDRVKATMNFPGILGRWSFQPSGDTTFTTMTAVRVVAGNWTPQGIASAP